MPTLTMQDLDFVKYGLNKTVALRLLANELARQLYLMTDMSGDKWVATSIQMARTIQETLRLVDVDVEQWEPWQVELCAAAERYVDYVIQVDRKDLQLCPFCLYMEANVVLHDCNTRGFTGQW